MFRFRPTPTRKTGVIAAILALIGTFLVALVTTASQANASELYTTTPPTGDTSWGGLFYRYQVWNFAPFPLTYDASYSAQTDTWWRDGLSATPIAPGDQQAYQLNTHTWGQWNTYWLAYTFTDTLNLDPITHVGSQYALLINDAYGYVSCQVLKPVDGGFDLPPHTAPVFSNPFTAGVATATPPPPPARAGDVSADGPWTCGIGYNNNGATTQSVWDPVANSTDYMFINLLPKNQPAQRSISDATIGGSVIANVCATSALTVHYAPGEVDANGIPKVNPPYQSGTTRAACTANNALDTLAPGTATVQHIRNARDIGDTLVACPTSSQPQQETVDTTATVEASTTNSDELNVNLEFGNVAEEGGFEGKLGIAYSHVFERTYAAGAEVSVERQLSVDPGKESWLGLTVPTQRAVADWAVTLGGVTYTVNHAIGTFPDLTNTTPVSTTTTNPQALPGYTTPASVDSPARATDYGVLAAHPQPLTNAHYVEDCGTQPWLWPRGSYTTPSQAPYSINNGDAHCSYATQSFSGWPGLTNVAGSTVTMKQTSGNVPAGLAFVVNPTVDQYGQFHAQLVGTSLYPGFDSYSYFTFNVTVTNDNGQTDTASYQMFVYQNPCPTTRITPIPVTPLPVVGQPYSTQFQWDGDGVGAVLPTLVVSATDSAALAQHNLALDADGTLHSINGRAVTNPGSVSITLRVSNTANAITSGYYTQQVTIPINGAQITSAPVNGTITANQPYSFTPSGVVNPAPGRWLLSGSTPLSAPPPGLSINSSTGVVSGPVTATGSYTFSVCLYPNGSNTGTCQVEHLTVTSPPKITSAALGYGVAGTEFSAKVSATGYPGPTFSATGLPAGVSINASTGLISGTPTTVTGAAGSTVTVTATNAAGAASQTFTLRVWQGTGVSVSPSAWSGSSVVARYPGIAVVTAHSTGATTASRLTLTSDTAATDVPLTPATAGGTIMNAPTECHLGLLSHGIANGSTLVYYGQASASSTPTWQIASDTAPLTALRTDIDPQRLLAPFALVGCVADPSSPVIRVMATNPGTPTLLWADIQSGTNPVVWHTIDAPPANTQVTGAAPGPIQGAPSLASRASGEYDLAVTGQDGTAWVRHYAAGLWGAWTSLGGTATSGLSITGESATNLVVAQRGTDGALYVDTLNGTTWSGWSRIASPVMAAKTAPAAVALGAGQTDAVVLGSDNKVYRVHLT